jgi:hypothetical protein
VPHKVSDGDGIFQEKQRNVVFIGCWIVVRVPRDFRQLKAKGVTLFHWNFVKLTEAS